MCVAVNQVLLEARHQGIVKPSVCVAVNQVLLEACHQGIVKPSAGDPEEQSSCQHVTSAQHEAFNVTHAALYSTSGSVRAWVLQRL